MILATARVPMRLWIRNLDYAYERRAVEALIEEFERTGQLQQNLSAEVDIVHRVIKIHADEKVWKQRRKQLQSERTEIKVQHVTVDDNVASEPTIDSQSKREPVVLPFPTGKEIGRENDVRFGLHLQDPLVDAPSIGPRTAERFSAIGIHSVHHFLKSDPESMCDDLGTRWISESIITLWQAQAKVMCAVPGLNCLESQLLAGAGFVTRQSIAQCEAEALHQAVSRYAATSPGKRYLRGQNPPTLIDAKGWIHDSARAGSKHPNQVGKAA